MLTLDILLPIQFLPRKHPCYSMVKTLKMSYIVYWTIHFCIPSCIYYYSRSFEKCLQSDFYINYGLYTVWMRYSAAIKNIVIDLYRLSWKVALDVLLSGKASCKQFIWHDPFYFKQTYTCTCIHKHTLIALGKLYLREGIIERI